MTGSKREEFRVAGINEPVSHYTDAVRCGDLLFVSGIAPLDAEAGSSAAMTRSSRRGRSSRT
jgi:enamine deaminase RidA (YjgF/YER057c/UK114 family)